MIEAEPQFGRAEPGVHYRERPAAFGVVERDGHIACVFITRPEQSYYDLPGGAVDEGETELQALAREFGEETGLRVEPGAVLGRARQFMRMVDGEAVNNRCALFEGRVLSEPLGDPEDQLRIRRIACQAEVHLRVELNGLQHRRNVGQLEIDGSLAGVSGRVVVPLAPKLDAGRKSGRKLLVQPNHLHMR